MNAKFLQAPLYLSLRLVKALRLSATPALLCSDRKCTDSRLLHDITNIVLCSFFLFNPRTSKGGLN